MPRCNKGIKKSDPNRAKKIKECQNRGKPAHYGSKAKMSPSRRAALAAGRVSKSKARNYGSAPYLQKISELRKARSTMVSQAGGFYGGFRF